MMVIYICSCLSLIRLAYNRRKSTSVEFLSITKSQLFDRLASIRPVSAKIVSNNTTNDDSPRDLPPSVNPAQIAVEGLDYWPKTHCLVSVAESRNICSSTSSASSSVSDGRVCSSECQSWPNRK